MANELKGLRPPKRFKWTVQVEVEVDACWVEDGFDLNNPSCLVRLFSANNFLEYAYDHEKSMTARVIHSPLYSHVAKVQGYGTLAEYVASLK